MLPSTHQMPDNASGRGFAASGFFVARTPLLPFEDFEAWGEGLEAPGVDAGDSEAMARAIASDRERLRARLMERLERPEIREALHVASPSLFEASERWRRQPEGKKGARIERALVRYLARMTTRATPFGLFSGCSAGTVVPEAGETRLRLGPRATYRRHTRLDMDCFSRLCESLAARPELRPTLIHRPNSSLYEAAGRLRYAESALSGTGRAYRLMALEASPFIQDTLARAGAGALLEELASALVAADPEILPEEARQFVDELVESQILVSDLAPRVTGPDPMPDLVSHLRLAGSAAAGALDHFAKGLARLDEAGLGHEPDAYQELIRGLADLGLEVDPSRFVQIDMVKPAPEAVLGGAVIEELRRGVDVLYRLAPRSSDPFDRFREAFEARFGDRREVPLMEVLDEEAGIGFRQSEEPAEGAPLLAGLAFPAAPGGTVVWDRRDQHLQHLVHEAVARGEHRIDLGPADLEMLSNPSPPPPPLPDALHVLARVAARSADALRQGRFEVHLVNAAGPSGARLLGRFCHADGDILNGVRAHVEEEERLRPDAVFAEVVHLQEGRLGNIVARPVLRRYEIPFLCRAAVDPEHQIPVSDLRVSVVSGRVVLTSERLGREVIPRLTTAHNYHLGSLGVYRFLCALQTQGTLGALYWQWGPLQTAPFLPRVTCGRLVLERARWTVSAQEVRELARWKGPESLRQLRGWRERRGLPRCVLLVDSDNELPVDFENIVSAEIFLDEAQGRSSVTLQEQFPGPEDHWVEGPEGRFAQELVVPFVRPGPAAEARPLRREAPSARRAFPPGSEWLFAKLYTGTATADTVLREAVAPVVRQAMASGDADAWFFIRYGDPDWHLRVRLHGDPKALHGRVLPALQREAESLLDRGLIWRLQFDTYQREVSRYGGPEAIWPVESLFCADSEAALGIVEALEGESAAGERWRLAVRGIDLLLSDLGLDLPGRTQVMAAMRGSYTRELRADQRLKQQLGDRQRRLRDEVSLLVQPDWDDQDSLAPGFAALRRRSRQSAPAIAELVALERSGRLLLSRGELALSLIHMHVNRLLRAEGRQHELVLAELLFRHYTAQAARSSSEDRL